jgi:hypothetical protein
MAITAKQEPPQDIAAHYTPPELARRLIGLFPPHRANDHRSVSWHFPGFYRVPHRAALACGSAKYVFSPIPITVGPSQSQITCCGPSSTRRREARKGFGYLVNINGLNFTPRRLQYRRPRLFASIARVHRTAFVLGRHFAVLPRHRPLCHELDPKCGEAHTTLSPIADDRRMAETRMRPCRTRCKDAHFSCTRRADPHRLTRRHRSCRPPGFALHLARLIPHRSYKADRALSRALSQRLSRPPARPARRLRA